MTALIIVLLEGAIMDFSLQSHRYFLEMLLEDFMPSVTPHRWVDIVSI
jgi:hypothetical protein